MTKFLVILFGVFAVSQAIYWKDCGSKKAVVNSVAVEGCSTTLDKNPCIMKRGSNATFSVDFTPSEQVDKATSVVHGVVAGIPVPFNLPQPDGCKDSGLTCPLKPNEKASFKQSIPIKKSYPAIKLIVKWELQDQNGDDIFCINVSAQVQ